MDSVKEKTAEIATINLKFFYLRTEKPDEFVDRLEELCREYSYQDDFFFKYNIEG